LEVCNRVLEKYLMGILKLYLPKHVLTLGAEKPRAFHISKLHLFFMNFLVTQLIKTYCFVKAALNFIPVPNLAFYKETIRLQIWFYIQFDFIGTDARFPTAP
jgi:hypothetical protein